VVEINELNRIIDAQDITTVFQPIVCIKTGHVIGYEALSRGPIDSPLYSPEKLFSLAEKTNKLWDLEYLCRSKAIERASKLSKNKLLFINVDPLILKDEKFKTGLTKDFLTKYNMSPESIIFEITERTSIDDFKSFKKAIDTYVGQGYKIAIDDTGAGYSGLKMLSETKPHYIKIDMDLVRDIDTDSFKQALMRTFVELCKLTGMKLIAEGIETEDELKTLILIGVYGGQGYFLQRPSTEFKDINEDVKVTLINFSKYLVKQK